jgi:single-strand DNA-binding protein
MFGKRAESLAKLNLTKGTKLAARGAMKLREFDKKDGGKGFSLEMRADDVELLGGGAGREPGKDAAPKYGTSGAGANAKHTAPSDDEEIPF